MALGSILLVLTHNYEELFALTMKVNLLQHSGKL